MKPKESIDNNRDKKVNKLRKATWFIFIIQYLNYGIAIYFLHQNSWSIKIPTKAIVFAVLGLTTMLLLTTVTIKIIKPQVSDYLKEEIATRMYTHSLFSSLMPVASVLIGFINGIPFIGGYLSGIMTTGSGIQGKIKGLFPMGISFILSGFLSSAAFAFFAVLNDHERIEFMTKLLN